MQPHSTSVSKLPARSYIKPMTSETGSTKLVVELDEKLLVRMLKRQQLHLSDIHCMALKDKVRLQRLLLNIVMNGKD